MDFKLLASGSTVIEGSCVNDTLVSLTVTPAERRSDVLVLGCTKMGGPVLHWSHPPSVRRDGHLLQ